METWNRVQGPPGGNAEGEELVHEGHEGTRSLGYQVRGVCSKCTRAASQRFVPLGRGPQGVSYELMKTPCREIRGVPLEKGGQRYRNLTARLDSSAPHATSGLHSRSSSSPLLFGTRRRVRPHPPESSRVTVQSKVRIHPRPSESRRRSRSEVQSTSGQ